MAKKKPPLFSEEWAEQARKDLEHTVHDAENWLKKAEKDVEHLFEEVRGEVSKVAKIGRVYPKPGYEDHFGELFALQSHHEFYDMFPGYVYTAGGMTMLRELYKKNDCLRKDREHSSQGTQFHVPSDFMYEEPNKTN